MKMFRSILAAALLLSCTPLTPATEETPQGNKEDVGNMGNGSGSENGGGNGNSTKVYKVRISFADKTLMATFDDNATSRALIAMMPMTLPMLDLYDDEMCYRFPEALPTDNVQSYVHKKGEIFYWPPEGYHSFVIRYKETTERLSIQHIGQIDSGVEILQGIGDIDMKFELME